MATATATLLGVDVGVDVDVGVGTDVGTDVGVVVMAKITVRIEVTKAAIVGKATMVGMVAGILEGTQATDETCLDKALRVCCSG
jgi:UDP-3-O-[3-hydroxymyristoyl] glucosamine N-acyltransferase